MWLILLLVMITSFFMCNRSFLSSSYRRSSAVSSLKLSEVSRSFSTTSNNKKAPVVNLYNELRDWRKRTSDELQTPVYRVMNNNLLESISTRKPVTMRELSTLSGIGHSKLIQYGSKILDIVRKHVEYDDLTASETDYELSDQLFWNDYSKFDAKKKKPKTKAADKAGSDSKVTTRKRIGMVSPEALQDIHLPDMLPTDLNDEQLAAANHILEGHNTFLTGSAGTGKTHVLKYVIQEFTNKYGEEAVAVTAPTGISALNIGGKTIHGFAGIGLGNGDPMRLVDKVVKNSSSKQRWKDVKVLIIDEISMLSSDLFELLDLIARHVRESDLPFGSIQVVIVGDFLQLPPVTKNSGGSKGDRKFCFQSPVWDALGLNCQNGRRFLETVVRQENLEFVRNLNDVRIGIATPNFMRMLNSCLVKNKPMPTNGIIPTKVYSINKQVDEENLQRLAELPGEIVTVEATDMWLTKPTQSSSTTAIRNGIENVIPEKINLKIGAQVMLLRNRCKSNYASGGKISSVGLVNGSRGKIIDFVESVVQEGMLVPLVQFDNGLVTTIGTVSFSFKGPNGDGELVRSQVPLKLAWAATVHKTQGCTLSCAELMLDRTFDYGQVYVALSRVTSTEGLWLSKPITPSSIKANPEVLKFYGYD